MYIETQFYDSGRAYARLHKLSSRPETEESEHCDCYMEEVSDIAAWPEDNLTIETGDVVALILDLNSGGWVDITDYC